MNAAHRAKATPKQPQQRRRRPRRPIRLARAREGSKECSEIDQGDAALTRQWQVAKGSSSKGQGTR
eukprot:3385293-Prymnesium_polylepis.1